MFSSDFEFISMTCLIYIPLGQLVTSFQTEATARINILHKMHTGANEANLNCLPFCNGNDYFTGCCNVKILFVCLPECHLFLIILSLQIFRN